MDFLEPLKAVVALSAGNQSDTRTPMAAGDSDASRNRVRERCLCLAILRCGPVLTSLSRQVGLRLAWLPDQPRKLRSSVVPAASIADRSGVLPVPDVLATLRKWLLLGAGWWAYGPSRRGGEKSPAELGV